MRMSFAVPITLALVLTAPLTAEANSASPPPKEAPPHAHDSFLDHGVIYEIDPWAMSPQGTLDKITEKLPHIAELGVKTLYIMPLYKHEPFIPYCVYDFYQLDPGFGTDDDLRELVDAAHALGMRVLLDLLVSHSPHHLMWTIFPNDAELAAIKASGATERYKQALGRRSIIDKVRADGTLVRQKAPNPIPFYGIGPDTEVEFAPTVAPFYDAHPEFFRHDKDGNPLRDWPVWVWGYSPNYDHPGYQDYVADVAAYWMEKYGTDGWRVDAPQNNWNPEVFPEAKNALELLTKVKESILRVKPDAVLYSERMAPNYGLLEPAEVEEPWFDVVAEGSMEDHLQWLTLGEWFHSKKKTPPTGPALENWLKIWPIWHGRTRSHVLETHDTDRIAKTAPEFKMPLAVLQYTLPGVPMIFCGQEIGENSKFLVRWDEADQELLALYKKLGALYRDYPVIHDGAFKGIDTGNPNLCAYTRAKDGEWLLVALNWADQETTWSCSPAELQDGVGGKLRVKNPLVDEKARRMKAKEAIDIVLPPRGYKLLYLSQGQQK